MRTIIFRKRAERDLLQTISYYQEVAPDALGNILADIYRAIDRLTVFPHSGTEIPDREYRRIVSLKYHYKIVHHITDEAIIIVGIYRYQNREV